MGDGKIEATNQNTVLVSSKLKEGMTLTEAEKADAELLKAFKFADGKGENGKANGILTLEEKLEGQIAEYRELESQLLKGKNDTTDKKALIKLLKAEGEIMQTKFQIAQKVHRELEKEKLEDIERRLEEEKQKLEEELENAKKEKIRQSIKDFNGLA